MHTFFSSINDVIAVPFSDVDNDLLPPVLTSTYFCSRYRPRFGTIYSTTMFDITVAWEGRGGEEVGKKGRG